MNVFALCVAALTAFYGLITLLKQRMSLFYQIVVFGSWCYLLAVLYRVLYAIFIPNPAFHAGYLAYAGTFFFLLSAYFGRPQKGTCAKGTTAWISAIPSLIILIWGCQNIFRGYGLLPQLLLVPVLFTAYFACKALLDKEESSLRSYNAVVLALCLLQPMMLVAMLTRENTAIPVLLTSLLSAASVPLAHRGCK